MSGVPKFFQPWITPEKRKNYISGDVTIDATPDHPVLHSKQEDDNENIVSSTTTMASTDSTTLKIPEKYDDSTMSDPDTTDSTSSDVPADYTRMDRQESDTSINGLATSATFSIKNIMKMNQYAPRVTLNMSRIFPPRRSADSTNLGRDPEKYDVGYDDLYPAENLLRPNESSHELPRMSENLIAPTSGEGISSTTIANVDVAGSWLAYSMSPGYYGVPYFPRLHPAAYSQIQPGIQSGVRGIPPVIHPAVLPGFFKHSMEEAVQMVHQQDAAAKQMKKMRPKKFQCQFCEAAFSNNGQLTGHTRIHTGERPFKCDVVSCGRSFTRNEELTRHKRIHTGDRPYSCVVCSKQFGRKDHLKKHRRIHEKHESYRFSAATLDMHAMGQLLQLQATGFGALPITFEPQY